MIFTKDVQRTNPGDSYGLTVLDFQGTYNWL